MRKYYPYLQDITLLSPLSKKKQESFLKQLNTFVLKKSFIKISLLDWEEYPLKEIQGELTGGSISKDGSSSVRRSGSISFSLDPASYNITDLKENFSLNKKVFVEIGVDNNTSYYEDYPIIWFPQGVFFISDFNCSINSGGALSASISLKDKMLKLSGDIGGLFTSTTILDEKDTLDDSGAWISKKVLIYDLIQELVHHFGGEPLENIVIKDVPLKIKKIVKWTGDVPLYLILQEEGYLPSLKKPENTSAHIKILSGQDVGYIYSDFIWTEELVANAGESICSILDKIKSLLGNFEYFYDEFGIFHFQEIKNYLNTTQATSVLNEMTDQDYLVDIANEDKFIYSFSDDNLISLNVTPQYGNIKNDYVVQGLKKASGSNVSYPVLYHLAIDTKPELTEHSNILFYKEKEDSDFIYATPVNTEYFTTGDISLENNTYNNKRYEDLYKINDENAIKQSDYQVFIENNLIKTVENIQEKISEPAGNLVYYTVKKENVSVTEKTGTNLYKDKISSLFSSENNELSDDEKKLSFIDKLQKAIDIYFEYGQFSLENYTFNKEMNLKNMINGLQDQQGENLTKEYFKNIATFYISAAINGKFTTEEAVQKIKELFLSKSNIWHNSYSSSTEQNYGNTYLLTDDNKISHFFIRQTNKSPEKETYQRVCSYTPKEENPLKASFKLQGDTYVFSVPDNQDYIDGDYISSIEKNSELTDDIKKQILSKNDEAREEKNFYYNKDSLFGIMLDVTNFTTILDWLQKEITSLNSKITSLTDTDETQVLCKESKKMISLTQEYNRDIEELTSLITEIEDKLKTEDQEKESLEVQLTLLNQQKKEKNKNLQLIENFSKSLKDKINKIEDGPQNTGENKTEEELLIDKINYLINKFQKSIDETGLLKTYEQLHSTYLNQKQILEEKLEEKIEGFLKEFIAVFMNVNYSVFKEVKKFTPIAVYWNGSLWQELFPVIFKETYTPKDWRTELYLQGLEAKSLGIDSNSRKYKEDVNFYFEELEAFWPTVYSLIDEDFYGNFSQQKENENYPQTTKSMLYDGRYYLDFIDPKETSLGEFSVQNIGRRQQVTTDDTINCLFSPEIPDIVFIEASAENAVIQKKECVNLGQEYAQVSSEIYWALNTGGHRKPAFDQIKYDLFLHTNYQKTVSCTALPLFYLEPNRRINIESYVTNTYGDFIIKNISFSFGTNSTMSISANEVFERF